MKTIPIINTPLFIQVDDEDFDLISRQKWYRHSVTGYISTGAVMVHQLLISGQSGFVIDHKDKNKLNNQKDNLRILTYSQNAANSKLRSDSSTGYRGVTLKKSTGKYSAQIVQNKKQIHLGYFPTKEGAAAAYNQKAKELYGDIATLNQI